MGKPYIFIGFFINLICNDSIIYTIAKKHYDANKV